LQQVVGRVQRGVADFAERCPVDKVITPHSQNGAFFLLPFARQEFQGNAILAPADKSGASISGIPLEACNE